MRILLAALGIYGFYRLLRWKRGGSQRQELLPDMRGRPGDGPAEARSHVVYRVVEHDGGWAYAVGDVFSETYATRSQAERAAEQAAAAHESAGSDAYVEYQDREGRWHGEMEPGESRPVTDVEVKGRA
ncbi:hypothetical protein [Nitratireductor thuwali]|uniref:DUF2188 domain-containing protein n=1 Tax=Nitratireductor thuwali TaxID=2267699 RepID=A0ABY5MKX4_9HYPH|nr:hypothetical protein NTH_02357 [Nitratireductor thuwali]